MKSFPGTSILVVEDEPELLENLVEHFLYRGAKAIGVKSGREAWDLLQQQEFCVVFSDMRMPDGSGLDLIKKIHQNLKQKPKIFLCTGYSDFSIYEAKSYGVVAVFNKPFDIEFVMQSILLSIK